MNCQLESLLLSILTSSLFIISLYIYPTKLSRNDPFTIKQRFVTVCIASIISLFILNQYNKFNLTEFKINIFNLDLLINGILKPIFILSIIQFVPILMFIQSIIDNHITYELNIYFLRDFLLAPFTEELNYRFILLKILRPCFNSFSSCLISSFLFGFSHFHHYILDRDQERTLKSTFIQFIFTFLFGLFVSVIYLKSNWLITAIILHSICNFLSLPDFNTILSSRKLSLLTIFTILLGFYLVNILY